MKALVGAFNQEKALVGAFSVIVQPVVEPMDRFTALVETAPNPWRHYSVVSDWDGTRSGLGAAGGRDNGEGTLSADLTTGTYTPPPAQDQ